MNGDISKRRNLNSYFHCYNFIKTVARLLGRQTKLEDFEDLIIYEDNHLLVITKPAGVLSQEDSSGDQDILRVAKEFIKKRDNKPFNVYLGLVHRLDRNTGGVMCFAKTSKAAKRLNEQIRNHTWQKHYLTMTEKVNKNDSLPINTRDWLKLEDFLNKNHELNFNKIDQMKFSKDSKKAELYTRVLAENKINNKTIILRENKLITGRSHQTRVQLASRGERILGDFKYGASHDFNLPPFFLGLWAYKLTIEHPTKKDEMTFISLPEPEGPWTEFVEYFGKLKDV